MMAVRRLYVLITLTLGLIAVLGLAGALAEAGGKTSSVPGLDGIIYVDREASGSGTGSTWTHAFTQVQEALAVALPGADIWVAEGVYYPDYDPDLGLFTGLVTATFVLTNEVALYGGFDPGAGVEAFEARDPAAYVTVLSGDLDRNDNTDASGVVTATEGITGTNAWTVVTGRGVDSTAVLDGFAITAGNAYGTRDDCDRNEPCMSGGGIYNVSSSPSLKNVILKGNSGWSGGGMFNYSNSNPTLQDVIFDVNMTKGSGGGMANLEASSPILISVTFSGNSTEWDLGGGMFNWSGSSPTMENVIFESNSAYRGGGMSVDDGSPILSNVRFVDNSASDSGGGILSTHSSPTLTEVRFDGNYAGEFGGGGMLNSYGSPSLVDVIFDSNWAERSGGGMLNIGDGSPMLVNVVFADNSAGGGGGMTNGIRSSPTLVNVTFKGNSAESGAAIANSRFDMFDPFDCHVTLVNCILWENVSSGGGGQIQNIGTNTTTISYSDVQNSGGSGSGWDSSLGTDGGNNIDTDPLFVGAIEGDLRPRPGSPAIDAGDNSAVPPEIITDLDGRPRIHGDYVDMGAYETPLEELYVPLLLRFSP